MTGDTGNTGDTGDTDDFSVMADGSTHIMVKHDICGDRRIVGTGSVYPRAINDWIAQHVCRQ